MVAAVEVVEEQVHRQPGQLSRPGSGRRLEADVADVLREGQPGPDQAFEALVHIPDEHRVLPRRAGEQEFARETITATSSNGYRRVRTP
jgi:hypothetical protein